MPPNLEPDRVQKLWALLGGPSAAACRLALHRLLGTYPLLSIPALEGAVLDLLAAANGEDCARLMRAYDAIGAEQFREAEALLASDDEAFENRARDAWTIVLIEEVLGSQLSDRDQAMAVFEMLFAEVRSAEYEPPVPRWWSDLSEASYSEEASAAYVRNAIEWTRALRARLQSPRTADPSGPIASPAPLPEVWDGTLNPRATNSTSGPHAEDLTMVRQPFNRYRTWTTLAIICAVLGLAAELGHMQWTNGGPSGLRGRGVAFDAAGVATWREAGVSLTRGSLGVWSVERTVAKESYDWGGGGAAFFGVDDEMGGPPASEGAVRWVPLVRFGGSGTAPTASKGATFITLPLWPLTALFLIGAAIAYRRAAFGPSACAGCGYDLRGLWDRPCPECGTAAKARGSL